MQEAPDQRPRCDICSEPYGDQTVVAREMMFGWRDTFNYRECTRCGCVQISHVPEDLGRFYPPDYFSFSSTRVSLNWRGVLGRLWDVDSLGERTLIGRAVALGMGTSPLQSLRPTGVTHESSILDIGSGSGGLLQRMHRAGFRKLLGSDPYIEDDLVLAPGLQILKRDIVHLEGSYDLIMMHHSLEHMPNQVETLQHVRRLLAPGGLALIRVPLAGSWAWRHYRADWVQLDPPRHLVLHTPRSLEEAAHIASLEIVDVVFDSTAFQFWGSEQYRRGVPLLAPDSFAVNPRFAQFSRADIRGYAKRANILNQDGDGDQAALYLAPS